MTNSETIVTSRLKPSILTKISELEKKNGTLLRKELAEAVREYQGKRRAVYSPETCPHWWDVDKKIDFGYGTPVSCPKFRSTGWKKMTMMAALALFIIDVDEKGVEGRVAGAKCAGGKKEELILEDDVDVIVISDSEDESDKVQNSLMKNDGKGKAGSGNGKMEIYVDQQENEAELDNEESWFYEMEDDPEKVLRKRKNEAQKEKKQIKSATRKDSERAVLQPLDPNVVISSGRKGRVNENAKAGKKKTKKINPSSKGKKRKVPTKKRKAKQPKEMKPAENEQVNETVEENSKLKYENDKSATAPVSDQPLENNEPQETETVTPNEDEVKAEEPEVANEPRDTVQGPLSDDTRKEDKTDAPKTPLEQEETGKFKNIPDSIDVMEKRSEYALQVLREAKKEEEQMFDQFVKQKRKEIDEYVLEVRRVLAIALMNVPDDVRSMLVYEYYKRNYDNISNYIRDDIVRRTGKMHHRPAQNRNPEKSLSPTNFRTALLRPMTPPKSVAARKWRTDAATATKKQIAKQRSEFKAPMIMSRRRRPMRQSAKNSILKTRTMMQHSTRKSVRGSKIGPVQRMGHPTQFTVQTPLANVSVFNFQGGVMPQTPATLIKQKPPRQPKPGENCITISNAFTGSPLELPAIAIRTKPIDEMNKDEMAELIRKFESGVMPAPTGHQ